jgi:hypothetical protein
MPAEPTPTSCGGPRTARVAALALITFVAALFGAASALGAPANYKGVSADGEVVFFETVEQLVPGDADNKSDVYERFYDADPGIETRVTRQVSLGPAGGNDAYTANFEKASASGTKVFFSTEESLVAADKDRRLDVYLRDLDEGTTTLVSQGEADCAPGCGNAAKDAGFAGSDTDGTKAFFVTDEQLAAGDTDGSVDVYERDLSTETTNLVSSGGNGVFDASLRGLSPDGSWAYFTTLEPLSGADADSTVDIYAHNVSADTTTLVSRGEPACSPCGNGAKVPVFRASSGDGSRVFFTSDESLVPQDTDTATDIYVRDLPGGPTALVSDGSSSAYTASFAAASADGDHVFFTTAESLVGGGDTDSANDVYEWSNGTIELVTPAACPSDCGATFDAASADSETVVFSTAEQLSGEDTDSAVDIYEQEVGGGTPLLVSRAATGCAGCANGPADSRFNRASSDASRVVFTTVASLSGEDGDSEDDIYTRDATAGETSLITTSPSYCPLAKGNCGATFVATSGDGRHVFFTTVERFTLEDGDNEVDIYERFLGPLPSEDVTRLVSTGNSPDLELGPAAPDLEGTTPESPSEVTNPKLFGKADDETAIKIYTTSNCSGEPVATGTAAQLEDPGISVTAPAGETTSFRATAEAEGFVSFCSQPLEYEAEGGVPTEEEGGGSSGGSGGGRRSVASDDSSTSGSGIFYLTPHTRITFAPAGKTRLRHPVFRFTDSTGQPGTHFECKLDRQHWRLCGSPLRLKKVAFGRHVLNVKAVNAAGDAETTPAKRAFKLVKR